MHQKIEKNCEEHQVLTENLFHRHAPAIFAFLRQQCPSREDAEDLLLEVFTVALEHKYLLDLPPNQQAALLWTIARNKQISAYRRTSRRASISIDLVSENVPGGHTEAPEHDLVRQEEYALLHTTLQTLTPLQQTVLRLRFVNEMRSPQIALLVGKSETAVRSIISRTLNQLRKLYREGEK